jgi:hypothetical protein
MFHSKKAIAFVAPVATAAVLAVAGSASADVVNNASTSTPLASGATLNGVGTTPSTLQAGQATISCSRTLATGTIGTNPVAGTGDVTGSITTLSFDGGSATTRCSSTVVGLPYATAALNVSAASPFAVAADAQAQTFTVSKSPAPGIAATLSLYSAATGGTAQANCVYNASSVTAAVNNATSTIQFLNAPLTYNATASSGPAKALCPSNLPNFDATIRLTSGGANVSLN